MRFLLNSLYKEADRSIQAVELIGCMAKDFPRKSARKSFETEKRRENQLGCGVEKIYFTLKPDSMEGISL